ncbi:MAG TPA: hypothetical protein PLI43_06005 [Albidovulum sp.]|uniref:hypothetical protein n=1 Tax=Albidovulum sp. TaxID=1872424 RepID=UPI002C64BF69|nr:hypothetical protein [Albidovulum sp.]
MMYDLIGTLASMYALVQPALLCGLEVMRLGRAWIAQTESRRSNAEEHDPSGELPPASKYSGWTHVQFAKAIEQRDVLIAGLRAALEDEVRRENEKPAAKVRRAPKGKLH